MTRGTEYSGGGVCEGSLLCSLAPNSTPEEGGNVCCSAHTYNKARVANL